MHYRAVASHEDWKNRVNFAQHLSEAMPSIFADVTTLTDANFHQGLDGGSGWLVELDAPWCGHCKDIESEWDDLPTNVKGRAKTALSTRRLVRYFALTSQLSMYHNCLAIKMAEIV